MAQIKLVFCCYCNKFSTNLFVIFH